MTAANFPSDESSPVRRFTMLYRAPGMSATAYLNLGMSLYLLFRTFVR